MQLTATADPRRNENGATAVLVAVLMTALMAAAGLGIDTSRMVSERQEAQRSADSAALAIAQDCAVNATKCNDAAATATWFANQNSPGAAATLGSPVTQSSGSVRVNVSEQVAKMLSKDNKVIGATAKASWNTVPIEGSPIIPMALPYCKFWNNRPAIGGGALLLRSDPEAITAAGQESCNGEPLGLGTVKSGTGAIWMTAFLGLGGCRIRTGIGASFNGYFSSFVYPIFCSDELASVKPSINYLLPVYTDEAWYTDGRGFEIKIIGFVPVRIHGWKFGSWWWGSSRNNPCSDKGSDCAGIKVSFERTAQKDPDFTYGTGGPNLGAVDIKLTD